MFGFFKKHRIIATLLLIVVVAILLVAITFWSLGAYTHHGEKEVVPDVSGLQEEAAANLLQGRGLQYAIVDSVFRQGACKGCVVEQYPTAGSMVKTDRKIYLTINAKSQQLVALPMATDISVRQARVLLESAGFKIDSVVYKPSNYRDLVLEVLYNGTQVHEGEKLPINSAIVLHVGSGSEFEMPVNDVEADSIDATDAAIIESISSPAEESLEEEIVF